MKSGCFAINYGTCADPDVAVRVARHAEAAGFESVWTGEHVVLPDPQPPGATPPPTPPLLDPGRPPAAAPARARHGRLAGADRRRHDDDQGGERHHRASVP